MRIFPVNTVITAETKHDVMTAVKDSTAPVTATSEVTDKVTLTSSEPVQTPPTDNESVIEKFFAANNFKILEHSSAPEIVGLRQLTLFIGDNYDLLSAFIHTIKVSICHPTNGERKVIYNLKEEEISSVTQLCKLFKKYGLFTELSITDKLVKATVSPLQRILGYITGVWLEIYAFMIIEEIICKFAESRNVSYEIWSNVKVANANDTKIFHELDVVFSIEKVCFAFEAKSGNFSDYLSLYNTRKEMTFVPDKYLLLNTSILSSDEADTLQYFYQYYVTGMEQFKQKLNDMINNAFKS